MNSDININVPYIQQLNINYNLYFIVLGFSPSKSKSIIEIKNLAYNIYTNNPSLNYITIVTTILRYYRLANKQIIYHHG